MPQALIKGGRFLSGYIPYGAGPTSRDLELRERMALLRELEAQARLAEEEARMADPLEKAKAEATVRQFGQRLLGGRCFRTTAVPQTCGTYDRCGQKGLDESPSRSAFHPGLYLLHRSPTKYSSGPPVFFSRLRKRHARFFLLRHTVVTQ